MRDSVSQIKQIVICLFDDVHTLISFFGTFNEIRKFAEYWLGLFREIYEMTKMRYYETAVGPERMHTLLVLPVSRVELSSCDLQLEPSRAQLF